MFFKIFRKLGRKVRGIYYRGRNYDRRFRKMEKLAQRFRKYKYYKNPTGGFNRF